MSPMLTYLLSGALLLGGVWAMSKGAGFAGDVLNATRQRLGYPEAAGAAFMGLATATPEISVNVASVAFGWPDLGLGAALGSNVPALPFAALLSYLAVRLARKPAEAGLAPSDAPRVKPAAVPLQYGPYLAIVALLAALTLPPPWSGLQPVDAAVLAAAFVLWLVHALSRHERGGRTPPSSNPWRLAIGLPMIAVGAVGSVWGAQKLGQAAGLPDLITGIFLIGFLCALPESLSAWRFTREGHTTFGVAAAGADGVVSLTLALIAPALIGTAVGDVRIYGLNLAALAFFLTAYVVMNNRRIGERLGPARVAVFVGGYAVYLILTIRLLAGK